MRVENFMLYSVVIPVYNSESSLEEIYKRIRATFDKMSKSFEVIFVNDFSQDNSLNILKKIKNQNDSDRIIVIDLYNNFGQQNALMCGFDYCKGDFIITIDDDLQNPPEEIEKLIAKIDEGYDVVYGSYGKKKDKFHKNIGSILFRKINHKIFNVENNLIFTSFRIVRAAIIKQILNNKTSYPYISGMLVKITRNIANVNVKHEQRRVGESNYTLRKLVSISLNLIINHSIILLKIISNFGLFVSFLALFSGIWYIIEKLSSDGIFPGWTTIVVLLSFYNALILIILFIFGIYLSRLLKESSDQKQYAVKKVIK